MARLVNAIMIEIDHLHPLHKRGTLRTLHPDERRIFQRAALWLGSAQNLLPIPRLRRLPIRTHRDTAAPFLLHRERRMRQQSRHTELRDRREHRRTRREYRLPLHRAPQLRSKLRRHLIAQRIRHNNKDASPALPHTVRIERRLLRHPRDPAVLRQILRNRIRPVLTELREEKMHIQPLRALCERLKKIIKRRMRRRQRCPEMKMKRTVIRIHAIVFPHIGIPNHMRLCAVKSLRVLLIKFLHLRELIQPLVVMCERIIKCRAAPSLHSRKHPRRIRCAAARRLQQRRQNTDMEAGKALRIEEIHRGHTGKTRREIQRRLHLLCRHAQPLGIRTQPRADEIIAKSRMSLRNICLQTNERGRGQRTRCRREEDMRRELCRIVRAPIPRPLLRELPKRLRCIIAREYGREIVRPSRNHRTQNRRRLHLRQPRNRREYTEVQIRRACYTQPETQECAAPLLRTKECRIAFHHRTQRGEIGQSEFIHPHRDQIRAELLARKAQIQQPVILLVRERKRLIDQIVVLRIIRTEQLFQREAIRLRTAHERRIRQVEIVQLIRKRPLLIQPENNASPVVVGQQRIEPLRQLCGNRINIHR